MGLCLLFLEHDLLTEGEEGAPKPLVCQDSRDYCWQREVRSNLPDELRPFAGPTQTMFQCMLSGVIGAAAMVAVPCTLLSDAT